MQSQLLGRLRHKDHRFQANLKARRLLGSAPGFNLQVKSYLNYHCYCPLDTVDVLRLQKPPLSLYCLILCNSSELSKRKTLFFGRKSEKRKTVRPSHSLLHEASCLLYAKAKDWLHFSPGSSNSLLFPF